MHVHPVQGVRQGPDVRETGRIGRFVPPAAVVPGHPVLDDTVQAKLPAAEFPGDGEYFLRGLIPLPALHITESPPGQHGGEPDDPGQLLQDVRTVFSPDNHIGHGFHRVQLEGEAALFTVELHGAAGLDQQPPAVATQQERDRDLHVVLIEQFVFSGIVENAVFMGAQAGQERRSRIREGEDRGMNGPD